MTKNRKKRNAGKTEKKAVPDFEDEFVDHMEECYYSDKKSFCPTAIAVAGYIHDFMVHPPPVCMVNVSNLSGGTYNSGSGGGHYNSGSGAFLSNSGFSGADYTSSGSGAG
jgi:uncharacterized membrane protein YgcG